MDGYEDLIGLLRARVGSNSSRKLSLDWRAADVIDALQARVAELEQENARLRGAKTGPAKVPDGPVPPKPPEAPSNELATAPTPRALSLQEAADLLGLSYGTVFENRRKLGFS